MLELSKLPISYIIHEKKNFTWEKHEHIWKIKSINADMNKKQLSKCHVYCREKKGVRTSFNFLMILLGNFTESYF
jgi:hypothetical protein